MAWVTMDDATDVFCDRCGAKLVPALGRLRCPRMGSCGRGGVLEGAVVEFVHDNWASLASA
ncbi:MAG: hypothetical protein ACYDDF_01735 [Thermoplasmatota archaeon]